MMRVRAGQSRFHKCLHTQGSRIVQKAGQIAHHGPPAYELGKLVLDKRMKLSGVDIWTKWLTCLGLMAPVGVLHTCLAHHITLACSHSRLQCTGDCCLLTSRLLHDAADTQRILCALNNLLPGGSDDGHHPSDNKVQHKSLLHAYVCGQVATHRVKA